MIASSTLRGEDLPNIIGDDQPHANETQQPRPQRVPNRQGQGLNVNNVWVQIEPEGEDLEQPCQGCRPNVNNVWVQVKPEGEDLLVYEMDDELNPDDKLNSYDELSSCFCTTTFRQEYRVNKEPIGCTCESYD